MMKKWTKVAAFLCATTLSVTAFSGCDLLKGLGGMLQNNGTNPPANNSSVPEEKPENKTSATSLVSLDINPSIVITVDAENKVVSVQGTNEDGQVLLYEETGIVGVDVEKAIEKIVTLAKELGYLDENNKVVGTSVAGENSAALLEKINAKVTATAKELGLTVTTDGEGAYSLLRDLAELKAKYPNDSAIQNIAVSDFKLAVTASETGEVSLDVAVTMDAEELVDLVANAHMNMEAFATEAYELARLNANSIYEKAVGMATSSVYMEYAYQKMNLTLLAYAAPYFMYEASASGFGASADALACVDRLNDFELTDTQVQAVLSALVLEDTAENRALLQDSDGKITVDSVEAYADVLFKNTPASEELESMKAALDEALKGAETLARQAIEEAKETYGPQIESIITQAEGGLTYLKMVPDTIISFLAPTVSQAIKDFDKVAADVRTLITTNDFSEGTLRQLAAEMQEKADAILKEMEGKLADADKQAIETRKAEIETQFADQKADMEAKIAKAEKDAKAKLAALKEERTKE